MTVAICGDGSTGLSASGTTSSDAYQIKKVYNTFTSVASGSGVKLPPTEEGEVIYITNNGANSLKVYPYEATTTIDGGVPSTVNFGCSAIYFAPTRTSWQGIQGYNSAVPILHYGSFYDDSTQTAAAVNTAYAMTFGHTSEFNGVSVGSPTSRIYVSNTGVYNIQFSAQLDKTSGAAGNVYIWLDINGTTVTESAGNIAVQGTAARTIATWNYVVSLTAGQYFRLMWSTDDTGIRLLHAAASGPVPAIPSIILTVTQVNNL
jgi:archaellum component FlaG (FlaF/FlaG flagellin family)